MPQDDGKCTGTLLLHVQGSIRVGSNLVLRCHIISIPAVPNSTRWEDINGIKKMRRTLYKYPFLGPETEGGLCIRSLASEL